MGRLSRQIFIYFTILLLLPAVSCIKENIFEPTLGDGETWVNIKFGHSDFESVKVETRATLDLIPESRVSNIYVFMFLGEKRIFAHYFDQSVLAATLEGLEESEIESWYVEQYTGENGGATKTHGTVHLRAPQCEGAEIYLIANIDSDMVNISPEKLNLITAKTELKNLVASMNQEITSRNGLFPMAGLYLENDGSLGKVDVNEKGIFPTGKESGDVTVELTRLDAKVKVNVRVATDYELKTTENGVTTVQTLKGFNPESWQVVNLPKGCFLTPHGAADEEAIGYFSTEPVMFETTEEQTFTFSQSDGTETTATVTANGFSFYMLENKADAKNEVTSFHERERKNKDSNGKYDSSDGVWTNAPENGTYLVLKGEVVMDVDVSSEAKQQQLAADVTYYVHLGNISTKNGGSLNDYNINRNTVYTYNITVKGVNKIELEVTTSQGDGGSPASSDDVREDEPGAEGMVYVAKETIYTFDAHYGQRVFCFDAAYIDPETMTWYVKTPFGREGTPDRIGDTEIPSGMDYKWVQFEVNKLSDTKAYAYTSDGGRTYGSAELSEVPFSHRNRTYPGDGKPELMDVVQFMEYIKAQTRELQAGKESDFRREFDQDWFDWYNRNNPDAQVTSPGDDYTKPWFRNRIYVTVFVNEFYYETDPITGEADPLLWKKFVNKPNRLMHLLCDNQKSLDGSSSVTGSVVTIRQRAIQTPYNIDDPELVSGWGCETEDENADSYLWYYPSETNNYIRPRGVDYGNSSIYNGMYNTARVWECVKSDVWQTGGNAVKWSDYLDYERENDYTGSKGHNILFLREDKTCLQYSAMMRNRDNNGNGVIDPDELRWYTASIGQLEFLFLGELGLADDATLYPRKYADAGKDDAYPKGHPYAGVPMWKNHVVSSTIHVARDSTGAAQYCNPQILWAEEGVSVSAYKQWPADERGAYTTKCVRNLGFDNRSEEYFTVDDEAHRPQDLVVMTRPSDETITTSSVYKFDTRRISMKSKRFRTSIELEPYDEKSEMSRLYEGFETGPLYYSGNVGVGDHYENLMKMLQAGKSPCPDSYRVPNIREVAVMFLLTDNRDWWGSSLWASRIYTSTYYSMGIFGNSKNGYSGSGENRIARTSWNTATYLWGNDGNINLNGDVSRAIRCVRDWNPDTDG